METGEKVIIALVVVVTIGVLGGAAVMMPIMEEEMHKPESCGKNCHEMAPFYTSLEESVHKGVDCHECHKPHGPIAEMFMYMGHATHHAEGMVEGMMEGRDLDEIFEEMAGEIEEKPPASPKSEYCVECHEEHNVVMPEKITGVEISDCTGCHTGVKAPLIEHTKHRVGEYRGYESPDYSGYECVACHDDHDINVTLETCKICHPFHKP